MAKGPHPSFLVVPALGAAGFFSVLITLPFDFPFFSIFQSDYLPRFVESAVLGLAVTSVLFFFRALRTWGKLAVVVSAVVVAHLLELVLDPLLPQQTRPCWDCTPTNSFTWEVAIRFLLVSGLVFAVCLASITPHPKVPSLLLASIGSACLGSVAIGFLDAQSDQARASLVINGRPLGVLWQPALATFLGLAVWIGGRLAARETLPLQASDGQPSPTRLPNRYAALCAFALFVLLMGTWGALTGNRQARATDERYKERDSQIAHSMLEAPPTAVLSVDQSLHAEDVMVTENLGDWKIYRSESHRLEGLSGEGTGVFPEREMYDAAFAHKESVYYMEIMITQYPNKDWARYELRNTPRANALYEDRNQVHPLTRFSGTVYQDGPNFYWSSEDKVILVDGEMVPPAEIDRFVEAYLQKYPSSVQPTSGAGEHK